MSVIDGFSPEQAVLGKASRLPASIASDENTAAHLNSMSDALPSTMFQQKLRMRTAARAAFAKADSSDALRRAMLRRSREWFTHGHVASCACTGINVSPQCT